jgi:F0F1-type ATP synthase assembly protein I
MSECALPLQTIAAKGNSMNKDSTRNRLTSGATEETMAVSYGVIGGVLLFGIGGYLLDTWLGTSPWLLLLGLVVGVAAGLFVLSRLIRERRSTG